MKQLIEEQKEFNEKFSYIADALDFYTKAHYPTIKKSGTEHLKDITEWHKQSLKQFIDELLVKLEEKIKVIEKRQKDFTNDPLHPFNAHLLGTKDALKNEISHLKELKEELN